MESLSPSVHQKLSDSSNEERKESYDTGRRTVLQFAVSMCRKHGLVKDRVTLLSPSDFLQIVQLCHAQVQKRMGKDFQAEGSRTFNLARTIFTRKQSRLVAEVNRLLHNTPCSDNGNNTKLSDTPQNILDKTPYESNNVSHIDSDNGKPSNTALQVIPNGAPCKLNSVPHDGNHNARAPCTPQNVGGQTPSRSNEQRKEETDQGETDSLVTAVMQEYDRFLLSSNHVDALDVLKIFLTELVKSDGEFGADLPPAFRRLDVMGSSQDPLQVLVIQQLADRKPKAQEDDSVDGPLSQKPLAATGTKDFTLMASDLWPLTETQGTEDSEFESGSQVTQLEMSEELVGELFHSYLQLLVNTRSELALARVFNSPDRGLTHRAFTHLKHLAHSKNMSLYQTATSVIMQLRLGGRGYAPDPSTKLLQYIKGLTALSDLMNTLQQVLEDTRCVRSSVFRVVGVVRKNLIGCKSQRYKRAVVEEVGAGIQKDLEGALEQLEEHGLLISPDKPACQGGSLTSRRPRRVLLHYLDGRASYLWGSPRSFRHTWLHDIPFGPHTPSRFPCLLSQFRSPAAAEESPVSSKGQKKETAQRKRKMMVSTNLVPEESDQPLLQRCAKRLCDTVIVLPSKTIVQPAESRQALPDQEAGGAVRDKENLHLSDPKPTTKRPKTKKAAAGSSNPSSDIPLGLAARRASGQKKTQGERGSEPCNKRVPKTGKKCRRRLLSPVKGQRSITSFFRV